MKSVLRHIALYCTYNIALVLIVRYIELGNIFALKVEDTFSMSQLKHRHACDKICRTLLEEMSTDTEIKLWKLHHVISSIVANYY